VHPKTGKVCVPIQPSAVWEFDPDAVPTVQELVQQLEQLPAGSVPKVRLGWWCWHLAWCNALW
jgi:hypothetical protein